MLDKSAHAGRAPLADHRDDFYATRPEAVRALLAVEQFNGTIWECCCGDGAIVNVLRGVGHKVYATDLVERGCPDSQSRIDFLMEPLPAFPIGAILTNPPYALADKFVSHALRLGIPKVAMLLRLAFLESERRSEILDNGNLARVYVFKNRLPFMHRDGWTGKKSSSSIAFAWFVWSRYYSGLAELKRIAWEPLPNQI